MNCGFLRLFLTELRQRNRKKIEINVTSAVNFPVILTFCPMIKKIKKIDLLNAPTRSEMLSEKDDTFENWSWMSGKKVVYGRGEKNHKHSKTDTFFD